MKTTTIAVSYYDYKNKFDGVFRTGEYNRENKTIELMVPDALVETVTSNNTLKLTSDRRALQSMMEMLEASGVARRIEKVFYISSRDEIDRFYVIFAEYATREGHVDSAAAIVTKRKSLIEAAQTTERTFRTRLIAGGGSWSIFAAGDNWSIENNAGCKHTFPMAEYPTRDDAWAAWQNKVM